MYGFAALTLCISSAFLGQGLGIPSSIKQLKKSAVGGMVLFFMQSCYSQAFSMAPASAVELVCYLWPVIQVLAFNYKYSKVMHKEHYICFCLAILAMLILFSPSLNANLVRLDYLPAYVLSLLGSILWVIYICYCQGSPQEQCNLFPAHLFIASITSFLCHFFWETWTPLNVFTLNILAVQGAIPNGIGIILWAKGMEHGHRDLLSLFAHFVPILSISFLSVFQYETIGYQTYFASILLVLAPTIMSFFQKRRLYKI